jgi:dolichyl-phosphate-mannose--protein O-mannosyl transferase
MENSFSLFGNMDASIVAWIAGGLACLFILIIIVDYLRQRRKHRRMPGSRATAQSGLWVTIIKPWLSGKAPDNRRRK